MPLLDGSTVSLSPGALGHCQGQHGNAAIAGVWRSLQKSLRIWPRWEGKKSMPVHIPLTDGALPRVSVCLQCGGLSSQHSSLVSRHL